MKFLLQNMLLPILSILVSLSTQVPTGLREANPESHMIDGLFEDPVIGQKGYVVQKIGHDVYWVTNGLYQVMFIVYDGGVVLVDAPKILAGVLPSAIAEVTQNPVTHIVLTHHHSDHIGAANQFGPDVNVIGHWLTEKVLKERKDPNRPVPTIVLRNDSTTMYFGTKAVRFDYKGARHVPGNIFIWLPQDRILMLADVIFPGWAPFKHLAQAENTPDYLIAHDEILNDYDFLIFIGGHVTKLGSRKDVELQRDYMDDILKNGKRANEIIGFEQFEKKYGMENPWIPLSEHIKALTEKCSVDTLKVWGHKLRGANEFTPSHCYRIIESQRIDMGMIKSISELKEQKANV